MQRARTFCLDSSVVEHRARLQYLRRSGSISTAAAYLAAVAHVQIRRARGELANTAASPWPNNSS